MILLSISHNKPIKTTRYQRNRKVEFCRIQRQTRTPKNSSISSSAQIIAFLAASLVLGVMAERAIAMQLTEHLECPMVDNPSQRTCHRLIKETLPNVFLANTSVIPSKLLVILNIQGPLNPELNSLLPSPECTLSLP
jgi:siroheme synthase